MGNSKATLGTLWPVPGSEDTELRCLMEQEADHGEASEVHT